MSDLQPSDGYTRTVRDLLEPIFRHKKKGLLFASIVVISAIVALAFTPSEYTSTSKLIVRRGREGVFLDPVASSGKTLPLHKEWESEINTELEILGSRELMIEVVDSLGSDLFMNGSAPSSSGMLSPVRTLLNPLRSLIVRFRHKLANMSTDTSDGPNEHLRDWCVKVVEESLFIEAPTKSDIITVSYTASNPEMARKVATHLVGIYLDRRIDVHRVPGAHQFFGQQTEQLLQELKKAEQSIRTIKDRAKISSMESSRLTLQTSIASTRTRQLENKSALASANARVATLKAMLTKQSPVHASSSNGALLDPTERLTLQATLRDDEIEQAALIAEANELSQQLAQLKKELSIVHKLEVPMRELKREQELLEEKYRKYYQDEEQARINEELETGKISNVSIVQHATLPIKADPSGKLAKLIAAAFLGLAGAIAIAFGADRLDPTLHSAADVYSHLHAHTLMDLPKLRNSAQFSFTYPFAKARVTKRARDPIPKDIEDSFQELLFKLLSLRNPESSQPFIIGVTSTSPEEGVSSIAANLAYAFARDDSCPDTRLLDAKSTPPSKEHTELMTEAPFTYQSLQPDKNSKNKPPAEGQLSRLKTYLANASQENCDILIVDLPSVSRGGNAVRMAAALDVVTLVIRAESVSWRDALRAAEFLQNAQAHLCGVILNRTISAIPHWLYQKL